MSILAGPGVPRAWGLSRFRDLDRIARERHASVNDRRGGAASIDRRHHRVSVVLMQRVIRPKPLGHQGFTTSRIVPSWCWIRSFAPF